MNSEVNIVIYQPKEPKLTQALRKKIRCIKRVKYDWYREVLNDKKDSLLGCHKDNPVIQVFQEMRLFA